MTTQCSAATIWKGTEMEFGSNFFDILVWTLWIWLIFAFFMVLFRVVVDLFTDTSVSGVGKFFWCVFFIFVPIIGILTYVIARGRGMAERDRAKMAEAQASQAAYIREVAGAGVTPIDQIASAKALRDAGTITDSEFDALKSKALAA